jgi:dihydrodipicolinate synthase/N-acetylneuraminate lyase
LKAGVRSAERANEASPTMTEFNPKTQLRGIVASLHTPFAVDDVLDEASLTRLVDHCAQSGCTGVLVAAVAGEVASLRPEERRRQVEIVTATATGRLAVIVGVSASEFEISSRLARDARAAGAAMVLWQPPAGADERALAEALRALGEAGPGQVMLQDLDWQGPGLDAGLIARLAEQVPALTAVKVETVPAGPKYSAVQAATGGRVHLSGGWAAMQMPDGLARGLDCFIPSGILPVYTRIWSLWHGGNEAGARALFERALPVLAFSNQHIQVSIAFWKQLRRRQGIFTTDRCRPPIARFDPVQQADAERLLARAMELEAEMA